MSTCILLPSEAVGGTDTPVGKSAYIVFVLVMLVLSSMILTIVAAVSVSETDILIQLTMTAFPGLASQSATHAPGAGVMVG